MALSGTQVSEAIERIASFCKEKEEAGDYVTVYPRGVLRQLGYDDDAVNQVLAHIFAGGFRYCLDPKFHRGPEGETSVHFGACYWSPDQLRSRLDCLWWPL